jgi:hypothetical protein
MVVRSSFIRTSRSTSMSTAHMSYASFSSRTVLSRKAWRRHARHEPSPYITERLRKHRSKSNVEVHAVGLSNHYKLETSGNLSAAIAFHCVASPYTWAAIAIRLPPATVMVVMELAVFGPQFVRGGTPHHLRLGVGTCPPSGLRIVFNLNTMDPIDAYYCRSDGDV